MEQKTINQFKEANTAPRVSRHSPELNDAMCELYGMGKMTASQVTDTSVRCFLNGLFTGKNKRVLKMDVVYDNEFSACNAAIGILIARLPLGNTGAESTRAQKCIKLVDDFIACNAEQKQLAYHLRLIGFARSILDYTGDDITDMFDDLAANSIFEDVARKASAVAVGMLVAWFQSGNSKNEAHKAHFYGLLQCIEQ